VIEIRGHAGLARIGGEAVGHAPQPPTRPGVRWCLCGAARSGSRKQGLVSRFNVTVPKQSPGETRPGLLSSGVDLQ
jgi:hypothetical protein